MPLFGFRDIEIITDRDDMENMAPFLYSVASGILNGRLKLNDGDTVTEPGHSRFRVQDDRYGYLTGWPVHFLVDTSEA
jgi:hypothetical protein